jgi:hypothetical protein
MAFSHFPVMEDGVYTGNIAAEDVETFDLGKKVNDYRYTLEGFCTQHRFVARRARSLCEKPDQYCAGA